MSDVCWISVVGIGEDGLAGLGEEARARIAEAQILAGGRRHLALVPASEAARIPWASPFEDSVRALAEHRGRKVVVLASGDPSWFGVAKVVLRHFPPEEVRILPHVSAFQLAAARLGWALEEVGTVSLHNRPATRLLRELAPGRRLLILTSGPHMPATIADLVARHGYGEARVTVFGHLGGPRETVWRGVTGEVSGQRFPILNLVALALPRALEATEEAALLDLEDDSFEHDGNITKAEYRAAAIARLGPGPGRLLWDVGAGSGAMAITWIFRCGSGAATAIERRADRATRIRRNAARLGTPELRLIEGEAPAALPAEERPDAVFLGGGLTTPDLLRVCYERLGPGGRLVAHAVTMGGEQVLYRFHQEVGGSLQRLALSRAESRGDHLLWRPLAPVTQYAITKR